MRRWIPFGILFALVPAAGAQIDDDPALVVQPQEQYEYSLEVTGRYGGVPLDVRVEHISGPPLNVVLLDEGGYEAFNDGRPHEPVLGHEYNARTEAEIHAELKDNGVYYVVVDDYDEANDRFAAGPTGFRLAVLSKQSAGIPATGFAAMALVLLATVLLRRP